MKLNNLKKLFSPRKNSNESNFSKRNLTPNISNSETQRETEKTFGNYSRHDQSLNETVDSEIK